MAAKLNFRQKGLPKTVRKRLRILGIIFVIALVFFQIILNRNVSKEAIDMADATLPMIHIEAYGNTMGELHGYTQEMDACYMRDALIPLDKGRKMKLTLHTYGNTIDSVSYEIRSLNTERKIADTKITDWKKTKEDMSTTLQIENLVEKGEEYLLVLYVKSNDQTIYYYTRIMMPSMNHQEKCISFAKNFHNTALSSDYESLASYVETSPYVDTDTLADVSIASTLEQIGWKDFEGQIVGDPLIEITDMNDDYLSLVYYFQMKEENAKHTNYYNVEEYFKIRYTAEDIYLLDYHRTMEQILDEGAASAKNNILSTGIALADTQYLSNETGTIVSFVQGGELFEYNQNKQRFTKVFGFISDPADKRQNYHEHNIRILNIDETGNMDFVVYGYMNRGEHEGKCGINLYHYDSAKQEAVEQVFISSSHSYQILNANFSNLLYENLHGDFYIMLGGTLAKVGLDDLSTEELITGLSSGQYAVSQSGQYVAWISEGVMADAISVMDLETENIRTIKAESGTKIKPLAFMTEDFVYGIADSRDITKDVAGSDVYPISHLKIVDTSSKNFDVLKDYHKGGYYISDVYKESFTLFLERITKQPDGTFVKAAADTIKDSAGEQNKTVTLKKKPTSGKGSINQFVLAELDKGTTISDIANTLADLAVTRQTRSMSVSASKQEQTYFVYVGKNVVLTTQNLRKAIETADENLGLVIDNQQRYIWKRGKKSYVNPFLDIEVGEMDASANTSAGAISAMLTRKGYDSEVNIQLSHGERPLSIMQKALTDAYVVDLTGCSLSQVLYYVSHGAPVYARTGVNEAVLIIGYDGASVVIYRSDTDRYTRMPMAAAEELFSSVGNVFISYIE